MRRQEWQRSLRSLSALLDDGWTAHQAVLPEVDEALSSGIVENFDSQRDETGAAWAPRKDNLPHPLLVKTGRMMLAAASPGNAGHKFEQSGSDRIDFGIYGQVVQYAIFHRTGTSKMPRRNVVYASEGTQRAVLRIVEGSYRVQLRQLGFQIAGSANAL